MNQIEFLLRLSENARDKGDEIAQRQRLERDIHGKELNELYRMIELAKQNVLSEMHRFGLINPNPQPEAERLPTPGMGQARAVTQMKERTNNERSNYSEPKSPSVPRS